MTGYKWQFTHTPLKNYLHDLRIAENPQLFAALHNNLTDVFFRDLEWRYDHERNINILINGEQGSGKSTGGQVIKVHADKHFGLESRVDEILFTRRQFLHSFKKYTRGMTGIVDEDFDYITQTGSQRVRESLRFIEQAIRGAQINLISCAVSETPHLYNYVLEAFDIEYRHQYNRLILMDVTQFGYRPVGFIILDAKTIPKKLSSDYAKAKQLFLSKVKEQTNRNPYEDLEKEAIKILADLNKRISGKLSKGFLKVHCRRLNPELSETEIDELVEVCAYLAVLNKKTTED